MRRLCTVRRPKPPILGLLGAPLAVGLLLGVSVVGAESTAEAEVTRGARSFRVHCATCHGVEARGEGPMAEILKVAPPDLTRLARDAGGVFPAERVTRSIDGRETLLGHGREMPVWGLTFRLWDRDLKRVDEAEQRIADLVAFLVSIQEFETPEPADDEEPTDEEELTDRPAVRGRDENDRHRCPQTEPACLESGGT